MKKVLKIKDSFELNGNHFIYITKYNIDIISEEMKNDRGNNDNVKFGNLLEVNKREVVALNQLHLL